MFQPGEEGQGGAKVMLDEGLLETASDGAEPVSMAFAIHQSPSIPSGLIASKGQALLASADEFEIVVRGKGGHASMPHHAGDPIPIAAEIVLALQSMVTRRVDVFDPAVVTVAKMRAGTTTNVIPETALLAGTVRTVSASTRDRVLADLERVATGIAAAHGAIGRGRHRPRLPGHRQPRPRGAVRARHRGRAPGRGPRDRDAEPGDGRRGLELRPPAGGRGHGVPRHAARRRGTRRTSPRTTRTAWCSTRSAMAPGLALYAAVALRWMAEAPAG